MDVITDKNLIARKPSPAWMQRLRASLEGFVGPGDPLMSVIEFDCKGPHAMHRIYSLGLRPILEHKRIEDSAKPVGCRFLAGGHLKMGAGCYVTHEGQPNARVLAVSRAPEISNLLEDTALLNGREEFKGHEYEPRVLTIPGLCLEAFWLKSTKGNTGDWVVPYGLLLDPKREHVMFFGEKILDRMKAYPIADFLRIVRALADKRQKEIRLAQTSTASS